MFTSYAIAFWGIWATLITMFAQHFIAIRAHRQQSQYIPGIVSESLSHGSFVFRSHRTFQNSIENTFMMLATTMLAIFVEVSATGVAVAIWVYACARFMHMVLYYKIATESNPSPRSYFFMIGLITNLVLLISTAVAMI
jgi:uncharacterized MAPEG superfamily protein